MDALRVEYRGGRCDAVKISAKPFRILGLTRYGRLGASSRQRFFIFEPVLRQHGVNVEWQCFFSDDQVTRLYREGTRSKFELLRSYWNRVSAISRASQFDAVWIEKELLPWVPPFLENFLLRHDRIILDLDDGWHLRYDEAPHHWQRRMFSGKIEALARRATALVVANTALADWVRGAGQTDIIQIPTVLNTDVYKPDELPGDGFTIAWIGSPTTLPYLEGLRPVLRELAHSIGLRLIIVSDLVDAPRWAEPWVEFVGWAEGIEAHVLQRCNVGLAPTPDGRWEQYKTGYKIIQYMAAGRAAVASPVGANRGIVVDGETGFFASTHNEWSSSLRRLYDDPELCRSMGEKGRARCEQNFSLATVGESLSTVLSEVCASGRLPDAGVRQRAGS